ncbi:type II CAAX prenyl endopeptidase Rce1 family protein [Silvibacterium sp.]|uniref:CPBP family glutamic-type intramembrane protease n=1 Tax=Silvibacterium sp. TaxID=1964179 RepID=UPI0039E4B054
MTSPWLHPVVLSAAILALAPLFWFGFAGEAGVARLRARLSSLPLRMLLPAVLAIPYLLVAVPAGVFGWSWFAVYLLAPVAVACCLEWVARRDPQQRGHWLEFVVLFALGLAVDLRWLEPAWPRGIAAFGKILLLDAGLYGFLVVRGLTGVGFDLRLRWSDWRTGLREWCFYAPIAIPLGLWLGFLHIHWPPKHPLLALPMWLFTFVLIALPEEIFFRGWMQNLLERRIGRGGALAVTAALFGLSHFNKRTHFFNWQYVLLAALAGVFYGGAWRERRRIGASAITHATVDTLWGLLLR